MDADDTELIPSGDACGACLALQGTNAKPPIHPNCLCQAVPRPKDCVVRHAEGTTSSASQTLGGEIEVECPDGTTIGESFELEIPAEIAALGGAEQADALFGMMEEEGERLCAECPESPPDSDFLCC